jgi:hypothetical protein
MIVNTLGAMAALVAGLAIYDLQRWCERRDYDRHFSD